MQAFDNIKSFFPKQLVKELKLDDVMELGHNFYFSIKKHTQKKKYKKLIQNFKKIKLILFIRIYIYII